MSEKHVFIYVATYADRAAALADYEAMLNLHEIRLVGSYDVAVIAKDAEGKVHVHKHEKPTQHGVWGGVLVGALVGVLFPPSLVGVATVGGAAAVGGALGGLGGHFLEGLSRGDAKEMGDLLKAGAGGADRDRRVAHGSGARQGADARREVDREADRGRSRAAQAGARGGREAARRGLAQRRRSLARQWCGSRSRRSRRPAGQWTCAAHRIERDLFPKAIVENPGSDEGRLRMRPDSVGATICFQADLEGAKVSEGIDEVRDREHLIDRLQNLRAIVPVFAQELASARRQAARLRLDNARLAEQVRQLQRQRIGAEDKRAAEPAGTPGQIINTPLQTPFDGVEAQTAGGLAPWA